MLITLLGSMRREKVPQRVTLMARQRSMALNDVFVSQSECPDMLRYPGLMHVPAGVSECRRQQCSRDVMYHHTGASLALQN